MSKEINEIFEKFKNVFSGRQEDIKKYLLKHYKNNFVDNEVLKVEKKDESAKIKTSGFHKNLSSWRNTYKNIVISTCMEIKGKQKRYDYKFYFTEERLNSETVEQIEGTIKESNRLMKLFNFPESLSTIDSAIELIRKKRDNFYNRQLNETRSKIFEAEVEYNNNIKKLEQLEEEYRNIQDSKNLEKIMLLCEDINKTSQIVRKRNVTNKSKKILEKIKKRIEEKKAFEKEIDQLELKLKRCRKEYKFEEALNLCDQIIEISIKLENKDIEQKYSEIKTIIEKEREELGNTEDQLAHLEVDVKKYREERKFDDALTMCDTILGLSKQIENKNLEQKYIEIKKLIETEREELGNIEDQIAQIESDIKTYRNEKSFIDAISGCDKIIELSKKNQNNDIEQKYVEIKALIENEIEKLRNIEDLIAQLEIDVKKYRDEKTFGEALSTCDAIIELSKKIENKDIEQKYIEVKKLIEKKLEEIGDFEKQIAQLVKEFDQYQNEKNFKQVLNTCENIIELSRKIEDTNRENNYTTIFNQIKKDLADLRIRINNLGTEGFEAYINNKIPDSIVKYEEVVSILRDYLK